MICPRRPGSNRNMLSAFGEVCGRHHMGSSASQRYVIEGNNYWSPDLGFYMVQMEPVDTELVEGRILGSDKKTKTELAVGLLF